MQSAVDVLTEADVLEANECAEATGLDANHLLFERWRYRTNHLHESPPTDDGVEDQAATLEEIHAWLHRSS